MSNPHPPNASGTVSDCVIDLMNRLRAGTTPAILVSLLTKMANNCADGSVTLPDQMRRLCCNNMSIEEALSILRNNRPPAPGTVKPLSKNTPLSYIARDIGNSLNNSGSFNVEPEVAVPIIKKYMTVRDDSVVGICVIFTSTFCINTIGSDHNNEIAAHIVASILIDENSAKHQNRNKVLDPRFAFVGVNNSQHKQYGNMTVIVYSKGVIGPPTSPARAPLPPRAPPPRTPGGASRPAPPPPSPGGGRTDETHTITKVSESPDKLAYVMELCNLTPEEFAKAELVKKGVFVVLRHSGREQMWRMPFPLPNVSSISAYCHESDGVAGRTSTLMLKIMKELTDVPGGKIVDVVSENLVVPTNPSVPPKVRPQIKLKSSSAESIEASLGVCSSDVHVNVKLTRTEVARSNVLFEFQFQEPTASGGTKTLKGNQTVRLPFVCSKNDINIALEGGGLNIRIHAPKPTPFDPNEQEQVISHA